MRCIRSGEAGLDVHEKLLVWLLEWEDKYLLSWSEIYSIWDFLVFIKPKNPSTFVYVQCFIFLPIRTRQQQQPALLQNQHQQQKQTPQSRVGWTGAERGASVYVLGKKFLINSRSFSSFSLLALKPKLSEPNSFTINPSKYNPRRSTTTPRVKVDELKHDNEEDSTELLCFNIEQESEFLSFSGASGWWKRRNKQASI